MYSRPRIVLRNSLLKALDTMQEADIPFEDAFYIFRTKYISQLFKRKVLHFVFKTNTRFDLIMQFDMHWQVWLFCLSM